MTTQDESDEVAGDYAALTVDTCIFDSNGLLLDRGLLRQLHQFQDSPVDLLICDIVHSELDSHLKQKATDAKSKIAVALKAANPHLSIDEGTLAKAQELLSNGPENDISKKRLQEFLNACGAVVIKASDYIEISDVTGLYFAGKPPFEASGDKKSEFPDAIALLTLEAWAKKNAKKVLAVSTDRGWKAFAEKSEWIDVSGDLAKSIAAFQSKNAPSLIAKYLREDLAKGHDSNYFDKIADAIRSSLDGVDIDIEAHAAYYYESDEIYATYEDHTILNDHLGKPRINLVGSDSESITVNIACEVSCAVHASFDLQAWDSIDREYLSIGSVASEVQETYQTDILITLSGDLSKGLEGVEIEEIEVTDTIGHADFGNIEPDWGYEE